MAASSLAITDEHVELGESIVGQLRRSKALAITRATADGTDARLREIWSAAAELGWLGLAVDEPFGGSGFGLSELTIVVEVMGHELCPGPFLPTVALSAALNRCGCADAQKAYLPALATGASVGAIGVNSDVELSGDGLATGRSRAVLGGPDADVIALMTGEDIIVVDTSAPGVAVTTATAPLDSSRAIGDVTLTDVAIAEDNLIRGGARQFRTVWRILLAAEAVGLARAALSAATEYVKVREQFGRPIGTFQAVKHHLADMLVDTEMTTAAVWDAARADDIDGAWYGAAVAAWHAVRTAVSTTEKNIQLHGGIGFTWEHDAHLYLRRAKAISALLANGDDALADIVSAHRSGRARGPSFTLPAEADRYRTDARAAANAIRALPQDKQRDHLVDSGYFVPHWPKPWGRAADPTEQLVIDEEFVDIDFPDMGITGWVTLTIVQAGNDEQRARWVEPVLRGHEFWCQLFSEPNAGSDAAAVRTAAVKVEGGWRVTGQKVWTSSAQRCQWGIATVRTDVNGPKHAGVTMMAIDMRAPGVDIRPLRELTGEAQFNEVFLDDVFVPETDVIGEVGQGWRVARATLGNERVSISGGSGSISLTTVDVAALLDAAAGPQRESMFRRAGEVFAESYTLRPLNIRLAARAVVGGGVGAEANVTKLLKAESSQHLTELASQLAGAALITGDAPEVARDYLFARCLTIAGGTSEIMRNTIAERILGLPRDPLAK
ncbi:acyl-CoA dehydrogenase FadE22 [Mycolicibacter sinensis]|uniref:Acyl-CoA dehydrogenase FadE22 n=1 Tax=Mycolicibacter sinensis (strain JDM601) TaxID=875328 RepID=F5YRN8_MYCSD|nr:acyl-CoA dehydrogenase [Mycolicibacter sinensis]AEF37829.1 acyl-CoA dehydrogenase FadE22 [Mycolicibacter sinensis]